MIADMLAKLVYTDTFTKLRDKLGWSAIRPSLAPLKVCVYLPHLKLQGHEMEMPRPPVITLRVYYPFHISLFLNEKLNLPHINFDLSTPICKKEVKYLVWSLLLRWDQNKKKQ